MRIVSSMNIQSFCILMLNQLKFQICRDEELQGSSETRIHSLLTEKNQMEITILSLLILIPFAREYYVFTLNVPVDMDK
jgi:hypothetical protein